MERSWKKRLFCMILAFSVLFGIIPMPIMANESVDVETEVEETASLVTYSEKAETYFEESAPEFQETDGKQNLVLGRVGNLAEELTVTVKIYDNSANYGQDYVLKYGDTLIEKRDGATSIFDAFRDHGELSSTLPVDAAKKLVTYQDTEGDQPMSVAEMLTELEELGALAAEFPVTFAAEQKTAELTVELLDDDLSEYEEDFLLVVLDDTGEVLKDSQILCTIVDNEEDPAVHVDFDCEELLEVDAETGVAQVTFRRTGNLATSTNAVLMYNGEPLGYVDFAPHQDMQVVLTLPGIYTLYSSGAYTVSEDSVTVVDSTEDNKAETEATTAPTEEPEETTASTEETTDATDLTEQTGPKEVLRFAKEFPVRQETDGTCELILTRADGAEEQRLTVKIYDNNASYGEDYVLKYSEETISKREGAITIYDAFRHNAEFIGTGLAEAAEKCIPGREAAEDEETVSPAELQTQMENAGALAAEFEVCFQKEMTEVTLTVELLDDDLSEYPESFLVLLQDEEGKLIENSQLLCTIEDNEEAPNVHVAFACEAELETDEALGLAELLIQRTGDLATKTAAVLLRGDEIVSTVEFEPYQETLKVQVGTGTYVLSSDGEYTVGEEKVIVTDAGDPGQPDPVLDAVPVQYDALPTFVRAADNNDWFPDWAKNNTSTYEDDSSIIVMGSSSNGLFSKDSSSTDGTVTPQLDKNMYLLDTEGGESMGHLFLRSNSKYNLTGIESIEGSMRITELTTGYCDVIFGVWNEGHLKIYTNDNDSTQNLKYSMIGDDKIIGSRYIYYCNADLKGSWDCGWEGNVPNGFKMNKRTYCIKIGDPNALDYNGTLVAPKLASNMSDELHLTMGANQKIHISYSTDSAYPAKLVGYKLFNGKTMTYSDVISLSGNEITFDQKFLEKYESSWCYSAADSNGDNYDTFVIYPIFEKIGVDYELVNETLKGTIAIDSPADGKLYKGDKVVFSGAGKDGLDLTGVHYEARKTSGNDDIMESGTVDTIGNTVTINLNHLNAWHYTFKGSFMTGADELSVSYASEEAKNRGTLNNDYADTDTQAVLTKDSYDKSSYYPLLADANDGYVTVWNSNGRSFYGDTFNYQLTGYAEDNYITVDFLKAGTDVAVTSGTITGKLTRNDVNLLTGVSSRIVLANTQYVVVTSHGTHSGTTDENGNFVIENFTGVTGGTYSMAASYQGRTGYLNFTYNGGGTYELNMPQFAAGGFYPSAVTATVDGAGANSNTLVLTSSGKVVLTTEVYVHSDAFDVKKVSFHFLSNEADTFGTEIKRLEAVQDTTQNVGDKYETWKLELSDGSVIPENTHLYVSVTADNTYEYQGDSGTVTETREVVTDLVNTGYDVKNATDEKYIPIYQEIPEVPGVQDGASAGNSLELLDIPVIGALDMSFSSKTGGYFIFAQGNDGTFSLTCGHSMQPNYATGTLHDKYAAAKKTRDTLEEASTGSRKGTSALKNMATAQIMVEPVFMVRFTGKTAENDGGESVTLLTGMEFALGLDANIRKNIPFNISGVPCYFCITLLTEAFIQMQMDLGEGAALGSALSTLIKDETDATKLDAFFCAPLLKFGIKGGVGWNNWASIFGEGTVDTPFIVGFTPVDAAANLSWNIGIGAELMMFSAKIAYQSDVHSFGNDGLLTDLQTIQGYSTSTASAASYRLASGETYATMEDALNNATFSLMEREQNNTQLLRSASVDSSTLASGVFKNTRVQLVQLDSGKIMALFLTDNHAEDGSLNYLSATYAISHDNGSSWQDISYVCDNTGPEATSLQYDINIYELQDRILLTWSEADLDAALAGVDLENITAAQIAKAINAMNLRGRFFDKSSGEPIGEAFTIAKNSTVFCGGLEAVQNGEMVYVYYQRNALPTEEDVTIEDLLSNERTIAMASANVNDTSSWESVTVRAMSEEGQQYRITEVVPFVHDGILGEVAVLDRNGRLAITDNSTGELVADVEDRQLYLRTYDFDANGEPVPTALKAITNVNDCAQSPQVLSNDSNLYLMWNQNGEVVYTPNFVARDTDAEAIRNNAYVIANSDGTYTVQNPAEQGATSVAGNESFHIGTKFTASMSDDGNVLVCWVGTDTDDDSLIPTDEIYGVMLQTKTSAEVAQLMNRTANNQLEADGDNNTYQLWAVGAPVAMTDGDRPIGALDSLALDNGASSNYLLAYSRFNNTLRKESTSADILTQTRANAPSLQTEVEFPTYPMPGTTVEAVVTVTNDGLKTLEGLDIVVSGVGAARTISTDEMLLPGHSADFYVEIDVPEDFSADAVLDVNVAGVGGQAGYTAYAKAKVRYGSYMVPADFPALTSIPNTMDCRMEVNVRNIGNASGTVDLQLYNRVYGSDAEEDNKEYTYGTDVSVSPGGEAVVSYIMEDAVMPADVNATVQVRTGEGYDQATSGTMPESVTITLEEIGQESDNPETPVEPSDPTDPTEPDEPTIPDETTEPDEPTKPSKPVKPVKPVKPEQIFKPIVENIYKWAERVRNIVKNWWHFVH